MGLRGSEAVILTRHGNRLQLAQILCTFTLLKWDEYWR